jgi:hypothetical protein
MKNASLRIVVTLALLIMMAAAGNIAWTQVSTKPPSRVVASSATVAAPNVAQLQAAADKSSAKIQASSSDKQSLVRAVRTKNTDAASTLLLKNGFTAQQLQGAKIELIDHTGGGSGPAEKIKITITVKCCPPNITIIIAF